MLAVIRISRGSMNCVGFSHLLKLMSLAAFVPSNPYALCRFWIEFPLSALYKSSAARRRPHPRLNALLTEKSNCWKRGPYSEFGVNRLIVFAAVSVVRPPGVLTVFQRKPYGLPGAVSAVAGIVHVAFSFAPCVLR